MKKLITTIGLSIVMLFASIGNLSAQKPNKLKKKINTYMSYPYLAQQNMEGEVIVSFKITNEGTLDVLKIDSSNPNLIPYVMRRLNKIALPLNDITIGSTKSFKFNFMKEKNKRA
jgi:predicted lipase